MTPERAEVIIEEIATVIRHWAGEAKGLAVIRLTLVRPSGDRVFIDYGEEEGE